MERMRKVKILFILGVMLNFSVLSCAPEVTDSGNAILKRELSKMQDEISATWSELRETRSKLSENKYEFGVTISKLNTTEKTGNNTKTERRKSAIRSSERENLSIDRRFVSLVRNQFFSFS